MHHFSFKHFLDHAHAIGLAHFSPCKLHYSHACWQRRKHPAIYNYPRHPKTLQTYQSEVHRLLDEFTEESFGVSSKYQGNDCVYGGEARSELLSSRPEWAGWSCASPADRIETFQGRAFKLLGFYRVILFLLWQFSSPRLAFSLLFPLMYFLLVPGRSSGRCNRITRDTYATGVAYNSARYVALGVLAWLSLGIAAACNQPLGLSLRWTCLTIAYVAVFNWYRAIRGESALRRSLRPTRCLRTWIMVVT